MQVRSTLRKNAMHPCPAHPNAQAIPTDAVADRTAGAMAVSEIIVLLRTAPALAAACTLDRIAAAQVHHAAVLLARARC